MDDQHSLKARVVALAADSATLDVGGQQLRWPTDRLPGGVREGDLLLVRLLTETMAEADRHEQARAILSQILGASRD